jgi:hypothetical protein
VVPDEALFAWRRRQVRLRWFKNLIEVKWLARFALEASSSRRSCDLTVGPDDFF